MRVVPDKDPALVLVPPGVRSAEVSVDSASAQKAGSTMGGLTSPVFLPKS